MTDAEITANTGVGFVRRHGKSVVGKKAITDFDQSHSSLSIKTTFAQLDSNITCGTLSSQPLQISAMGQAQLSIISKPGLVSEQGSKELGLHETDLLSALPNASGP